MDDDHRIVADIGARISELEREHSRPGWTIWALVVSLSAVVWILLGAFATFKGSWDVVARYSIAIYLLGRLITQLLLSNANVTFTSDVARVEFTNSLFRSAKRSLIYELFLTATLIVALTRIQLIGWIRIVGVSWLILYGLVLCARLLISLIHYPLVVAGQRSNRASQQVIAVALLAVPIVVVTGAILPTIGTITTYLMEIRISAAIAAVALLSLFLVDHSKPNSMIVALKNLRSDLMFGGLSAEDANNRLEIILLGFRLKQAADPELSAVLAEIHELTEMNRRFLEHFDLLVDGAGNQGCGPNRERIIEAAKDALRFCVSEQERIVDRLNRDNARLGRKLLVINGQCKDPLEPRQLIDIVKVEVDKLKESFDVIHEKLESPIAQSLLSEDDSGDQVDD